MAGERGHPFADARGVYRGVCPDGQRRSFVARRIRALYCALARDDHAARLRAKALPPVYPALRAVGTVRVRSRVPRRRHPSRAAKRRRPPRPAQLPARDRRIFPVRGGARLHLFAALRPRRAQNAETCHMARARPLLPDHDAAAPHHQHALARHRAPALFARGDGRRCGARQCRGL